jgi:hypothetical protein
MIKTVSQRGRQAAKRGKRRAGAGTLGKDMKREGVGSLRKRPSIDNRQQ